MCPWAIVAGRPTDRLTDGCARPLTALKIRRCDGILSNRISKRRDILLQTPSAGEFHISNSAIYFPVSTSGHRVRISDVQQVMGQSRAEISEWPSFVPLNEAAFASSSATSPGSGGSNNNSGSGGHRRRNSSSVKKNDSSSSSRSTTPVTSFTTTPSSTLIKTPSPDWTPKCGTEGVVVHRWLPTTSSTVNNAADGASARTTVSMTMTTSTNSSTLETPQLTTTPILLLRCEEDGQTFFVPVAESGAMDLGAEV